MANAEARRPRTSTIIGASAVAVIAGLVTTLAVVWPGFEAQQTPLDDGTLWAVQTGAGDGYARVNLELGELDTVKTAENASAIAQTADALFVFADAGTQFADVDLAAPADLTATSEDAFERTPTGTEQIAAAGDFLAFRTDAGGVYAATLSGGGATVTVDPYADVEVAEGEERPRFVATAVAIDEAGVVFAYSAAEGRVLRADARTGRITGEDAVADPPADVQLAAVGGDWVLLDEATGDVRIRGQEDPIPTGAVLGAKLQQSTVDDAPVYVADADGLVRVQAGTSQRIVDEALGTPASPTAQNGVMHAAWLRDSGGGSLWSSDRDGLADLSYGTASLGEQIDPAFIRNGTRIALNERGSGWVWTVPDGVLVPSSQQWDLDDASTTTQEDDTVLDRVIDPKPPVAVDDAFGVRAGAVVVLPVLLNDHDPNEDVLSIDPGSVTGLDPGFGTLSAAGAEQQLVVRVADDATGTASFRYRVTDGTSADGLYSATATVTLTVVPAGQNSAPVWCGGDDGCLAKRPAPSVAPGGTVTVDALRGWVDPEGDPVYLTDATRTAGDGDVAAQPDGTVTYQHDDPDAAEIHDATIAFTVADSRGAAAQGTIEVDVTGEPELAATSFAVVGVAGDPVAVDLAPYVTGATGTPVLSAAAVIDDSRATVTPNAAGLSMDVNADTPGSYLVQYSVRDGRGEASGIVRVTLRDRADAAVSTPPLTAFVRPNEDATVDVFGAVVNPAGLVLLLSDLRPESDPNATMSVDLVGQSMIRVSGSTDSGEPGLLGTVRYTVSDGTGTPAATAEGELTVILLPAPTAADPIAVDDAVTVRAGAQIDIPVLDNDTAPAGALVSVDPSQIVNESGAGLAFGTSSLVRYLAPDEPGTYAVGYTIFRLGFPTAVDSARIVITVVGDEANRAPIPRLLEGRVLSGETVRIPFDSFGVDPDGDAVTLDRVLTQPAHGTATISPEGDAIVYTSPEAFSGQDAFTYQVRDSEGATGRAEVRIGVLAAVADPSPVTFSDYLQIQIGEDSTATVRPADNDLDPAGGELTLVSVEPNAIADTEEHATLAALLGDVVDGTVTLHAGLVPGTFSYTYTVRNDSGDTSIGLIVVKAVTEPVPDYPLVQDTTLTIESREAFTSGIDVVTDKVSWNTGDVSGLTLSLWGSQPGIRVDGWRISGPIPQRSQLIPFAVTGASFDGTEITSYGFLRVPGDADIQLSLRDDYAAIDVLENGEREFDMAAAVAVPAGTTLQIDRDGVRAGGARAAATCALVSGTTIRYTAGAGAPWADTCVVPVKLDVQDAYTYLTVRVRVEAEEPEPILRTTSQTVSPGGSISYDLTGMVGWAGKEDWDSLEFATSYHGDQFVVERAGAIVNVTANDAARPGREEAITVTLSSHRDAAAAALNLTVGPAPSQLPKGGSASQRCSQSDGATSCTIPVIGVRGEVNPLPGTPLTLVSATGPANCSGVSFAVASATAVRATWTSDAAGAASCEGSFVVADAQGRQSSGARNGQVVLDLQGLPAAPTRLEWTGYTGSSVTLRVISDTSSYPAVQGFRITADGRTVATCDASGACPAIPATAGQKVSYQARAFNAVGESRGAVETTAWAYASPDAPTGAEVTPVPTRDGSGGVATITVTGVDPSTGSLTLSGGAGGDVTRAVTGNSVTFTEYFVGSNSPTLLTATPRTKHDLPPVAGGSQVGAVFSFRANGIGAPGLELTVTASKSSDRGSVTATATVRPNGVGDRILVGFSTRSNGACQADQSVDAGGGQTSVTFDDQDLWQQVTVYACAVTERGGSRFGVTTAQGSDTPVSLVPVPTGSATYSIDPAPQASSGGRELTWSRMTGPGLSAQRPFELRYRTSGADTTDFRSLFSLGSDPGEIGAVACSSVFGCSDPVAVVPTGAAYTTRVTFPASCVSDQAWPETGAVRVTANPSDYTVTRADATDGAGVVTLTFTVTWKSRLAGLDSASYRLTCDPPTPEPEPEPEPEPTETPTPAPTDESAP